MLLNNVKRLTFVVRYIVGAQLTVRYHPKMTRIACKLIIFRLKSTLLSVRNECLQLSRLRKNDFESMHFLSLDFFIHKKP